MHRCIKFHVINRKPVGNNQLKLLLMSLNTSMSLPIMINQTLIIFSGKMVLIGSWMKEKQIKLLKVKELVND